MKSLLISIEEPSSNIQKFDEKDMKEHIIVFDGGLGNNPPIKHPTGEKWKSIRLSTSNFSRPECTPTKGLIYPSLSFSDDVPPIFILAPRQMALQLTNMQNNQTSETLCNAFSDDIKSTKNNNTRSGMRRIYSPYKAGTIGIQACRNAQGLKQGPIRNTIQPLRWDAIVKYMTGAEAVFRSIMPTNILRHTQAAWNVTKYDLLFPTSGNSSEGTKIFPSMNIMLNGVIRYHTDHDHTYSIASVHLKNHSCKLEDDIVAYMCFPREIRWRNIAMV